LNTNKACGQGKVSFWFLRVGGEALAPILSLYFSSVLELDIFPQSFKTATVIPVFKAGSKLILNNIN